MVTHVFSIKPTSEYQVMQRCQHTCHAPWVALYDIVSNIQRFSLAGMNITSRAIRVDLRSQGLIQNPRFTDTIGSVDVMSVLITMFWLVSFFVPVCLFLSLFQVVEIYLNVYFTTSHILPLGRSWWGECIDRNLVDVNDRIDIGILNRIVSQRAEPVNTAWNMNIESIS